MTTEETHGLCDGGCAPDECVCVSAKAVKMIDHFRAEVEKLKEDLKDSNRRNVGLRTQNRMLQETLRTTLPYILFNEGARNKVHQALKGIG